MTVIFMINATTAANNCLEVVPGSHINEYERSILPQEKHDGSISMDWVNKHNRKSVHRQAVCIIIMIKECIIAILMIRYRGLF